MEDMRLGGPQKQLINLLNQLIKNKNVKKYHLILPLGSKKIISKFLDPSLIKIEEIDIQYLSKRNILRYFLNFIKESIEIRKKLLSFNSVYLPGGTSNLKSLLISVILKKKIFFHVHDTKLNKLSKFLIFALSRNLQTVFFASEKSQDYYKYIFQKSKKILLRSSVLPIRIKIRKKTNNILNIGMVANINPDKNIELFIDIVKSIKSKKIKFHLIGNLWDSQKKYFNNNLNSLKPIKQKINWYKNIYNPEKIMKKFDLLICTSKYESLPLSIIEALNLGIPVISNDVGDIKKVINKNKLRCGFIINDQDPKKFIDKIKYYEKNRKLLNKHSYNAKKNVLENFSIVNYTEKINKIFKV